MALAQPVGSQRHARPKENPYENLTPEQRTREYVRIAWPIVVRTLTQGTAAAANDIVDDGCAANAGRGQAAAAPLEESVSRPAVG